MLQIIILAFLFVYSLAILFFRFLFRKRIMLDLRLKKVTASQIQNKKDEEDILSKPFSERVIRPVITLVTVFFSRFVSSKNRQKLQQALQQAGNPGNLKAHEYQSFQLLFMLVGMLVVFVMARLAQKNVLEQLTLLLFVIIASFLMSKLFLNSKIRKRKAGLLKELPDALDLLTVSVEAGLGFDGALTHLTEKSKGTLAAEFRITLKELQMGKSRREALRGLGERNSVDDLQTFVGALVQADQLGVPIGKILRSQAEQVRTRKRQRVEEKAMKAPIKMLIPLVFFIFPSIFIVLLGPAAIKIYETLQNMI